MAIRLSQQWIVAFFTFWEHEFRPRLAESHAVQPNEIVVPLLGDLRLLRNDVVHHRGVATAETTGRCEILGHWFELGDEIYLAVGHFIELTALFPWDDLSGPDVR